MSQSSPLSEQTLQSIEQARAQFPAEQQRSAVLAALHAAQHQNGGHLNVELMDAVAEQLSLDKIAVYEVASFYSMYALTPVGRHCVSVCTNVSCMLMGSDEIVSHIEQKLGIQTGQSTPDGRIYLKREEECLAACTGGPMMQVDHVYHTNLTPDRVDAILESLD